jgi:hypothetical protein
LIHVTISFGLNGFTKNASKVVSSGGWLEDARTSDTPGQWARAYLAKVSPSWMPRMRISEMTTSTSGDSLVGLCGLENLETFVAKDISQHEPHKDVVLGNNNLRRLGRPMPFES